VGRLGAGVQWHLHADAVVIRVNYFEKKNSFGLLKVPSRKSTPSQDALLRVHRRQKKSFFSYNKRLFFILFTFLNLYACDACIVKRNSDYECG
jgi:hypothetical protein